MTTRNNSSKRRRAIVDGGSVLLMSDSFLAAASIRTVDARPRRRRKSSKYSTWQNKPKSRSSTLLWSMALSFTQRGARPIATNGRAVHNTLPSDAPRASVFARYLPCAACVDRVARGLGGPAAVPAVR